VFHLAAQPLVLEGYREPVTTVATNVLGTVNVLEAARRAGAPAVLVLVTSDKCYENLEIERGYHEDDRLGGADVYSGSKAAAELLISSYRRSFFAEAGAIAVASVRAGNVIGGGDWAPDRLVPDAIRALRADRPIDVRHPEAVRPWQHVLEPLSGYLQLGAQLLARREAAQCTAWNFGPAMHNTRTVRAVVERIVRTWGSGTWRGVSPAGEPHEATLLRLDIDRAQSKLRWTPRWDFERAVDETVQWYREYAEDHDMSGACLTQIAEYEKTPAGIVTTPA
jgi:CDP-glucose 4,6-dehydratase